MQSSSYAGAPLAKLTLSPNLIDPDGFYEALLVAHEGLSAEESAALNARLILILANQIGEADLLSEAIELAKAK